MLNKKRVVTVGLIALMGIGCFSSQKDDVVQAKEMTGYHSVKKGDNLFRIALNNGYTLDELTAYNKMDKGDVIHPQDKIYLPEKSNVSIKEVKEVKEVKEEKEESKKEVPVNESKTTYTGLLDWQYAILCAVVQQESVGLTQEELIPENAYDSALAVMSSITNRVDANTWYGSDVYDVITAPSQYESFGENHYKKQLGNILDVVKQAVNDGLNGKKNHNYLNFRAKGYADTYGFKGVNIGGNVYFND